MNFNNYNFAATGWALDRLQRLVTASEKLVLINLAGRHNEDENCARPGIDRIAADLGIEPRSVKRALKNLAKIGILRVQMRDKLKLPSLYFLNFDFHFEGVGDKKSPKAEKMPVRVTKSRCEGDKKSPTRVTESHPNKQEDNKLLKKQQQPVVVLEKLVWEKPLTAEEKTDCEFLLAAANLPPEICQKFADEMTGQGRREPIRNPAGWLKNMLGRYGQQGFSFGYANQVAAARAARAAQAERESLALPPRPKSEPRHHPAQEGKILSPVGRAALAASRAVLKLPPLASPPLVKHQPPVSPGATSAHTVATSTPAAAPP